MSDYANVRIPADVDRPDKVLGPLTLRQLVILAATGLLLYLLWTASHGWLPTPLFLALALPVAAAAAAIALGQRDGMSLDRLLLAALRQRLSPRYQVAAPEGVRPVPTWVTAAIRDEATATARMGGNAASNRGHGAGRARSGPGAGERIAPAALRLPAQAVDAAYAASGDIAVVDLGNDGLAAVAVCSTVNFALRTGEEQDGLVASFGRFLHSLSGAVQIVVRTQRLDLSEAIAELRERAGGLPHPALEAAALDHADYLSHLATNTDLWRRQVLLILREPLGPATPPDGLGGPSPAAALGSLLSSRSARRRNRSSDRTGGSDAAVRAAEARLVRRLTEAMDLLGGAGIVVTPLTAGQATTVLASASNPDTLLPSPTGLAGADEVITGPPSLQDWPADDSWSDQDTSGHTGSRVASHRGDDAGYADDSAAGEDWAYGDEASDYGDDDGYDADYVADEYGQDEGDDDYASTPDDEIDPIDDDAYPRGEATDARRLGRGGARNRSRR